MFGFYIKKSFCDGWDNLFSVVLANLVFIISCLGLAFIYSSLIQQTAIAQEGNEAVFYLVITVFVFLVFLVYSITAFAFGEMAFAMADFRGTHILDFFKNIPGVLKDALMFAALNTAVALVSVVGLTWYFGQGTYFYFILGGIFLWIDIFYILAMQWFVAIRSIMHNPFKKCFKKCWILLLDNTGFTIAMGLQSLLNIVISIACIGFVPSVAGITLSHVDALRLRLYKYDYLEAHPELDNREGKKHIPWEELIFEDREALGPRKFRSFIFPWKE